MRSRSDALGGIKSATTRIGLPELLVLVILVVCALSSILSIYYLAGPQWDLSVREIQAHTILDYFTHSVSPQAAFIGEFTDNKLFYFEPYREPASILVMTALLPFFQNPIVPYLILMFFIYIFAFYKLSKQLGVSPIIAFPVFLNGYSLYFLFLPNGGEILSVIFILFALFYILRKNPVSGLFLGLAMMAKYPAIALLPLVLFLGTKKKIAIGIALEALAILPLMFFDYFLYGSPIYSFTESIANANSLSTILAINPLSILAIVIYPIVIFAIGVIALRLRKQKVIPRMDFTMKLILAMTLLSVIEGIVIIPHNDPETQARYGYLIMTGLLVISMLVLNNASNRAKNLKYFVNGIAIFALLAIICYSFTIANVPSLSYYNPNNPNGIYAHAGTELASLGFANCRFISNNWIGMLYSGYDAYSPFVVYPSPIITPDAERLAAQEGLNYSSYVGDELRYPIIVFKYNGVPKYSIVNLNQSRSVYDDQNISIYLPAGAGCYTN